MKEDGKIILKIYKEMKIRYTSENVKKEEEMEEY